MTAASAQGLLDRDQQPTMVPRRKQKCCAWFLMKGMRIFAAVSSWVDVNAY